MAQYPCHTCIFGDYNLSSRKFNTAHFLIELNSRNTLVFSFFPLSRQLTADVTSNLSYINYDELDEILIHYILTKKPGRNALKVKWIFSPFSTTFHRITRVEIFQVLYKYLKYHADWLHIKLRIKSETRLNTNLLHKMFYIGDSEYDQVSSIHIKDVLIVTNFLM